MTTEAEVGDFVLACLGILTGTLIFLRNAQFSTGRVPYRTYLPYAGGLEPGSSVLSGGINVGRVTAVRPWASDPTRIEILLDLKQGTPVNEKSLAKLGSVTLMSEPALVVSTGSNASDLELPVSDARTIVISTHSVHFPRLSGGASCPSNCASIKR